MPEDVKKHFLHMEGSGRRINLAEITADDIDILDIARNLSRIPRWTGNTCRPVMVGEHSVQVMQMVQAMGGTPMQVLKALMHDSPEYILGDIAAPHKAMCPAFREYEVNVITPPIAERFGIPLGEEDPLVKKADWISLYVEAMCLCKTADITKWERYSEFKDDALAWIEREGLMSVDTVPHPELIEEAFLECFYVLYDEVHGRE